MTRPFFITAFCIAGLLASILVAARLTPGGLELRVTLVKENTPVLVLPLDPNEKFTIHYYHSVENAPIWEVHTIDRTGHIFIDEERYEKFGAGMGKMPGIGRMVTKGKYEAITDMHMPVGNFILRVGSIGVNHTLIWRDRQFNLSPDYAHQAVLVSGRAVSMLHQWWHLCKTATGRLGLALSSIVHNKH